MSGRGTIKAGTYGGRRYRQKEAEHKVQKKQLAKDIKKETKERAPSSKQIRAMPRKATPGTITTGRRQNIGDPARGAIRLDDPGGFNQRALNNYILDTGGGRSEQRVLQAPLGRGGYSEQGQSLAERNRDIQRAVNTMPLKQDKEYLNLIRQEVEQRHREQNNPDIDFEDFNEQEDIEEEQAVEAGQVDEETGAIELGTEPITIGDFQGADALDGLDFDPFADPGGVIETDSDEEAEEFGRQLDKIASEPDRPTRGEVRMSLAEKIEERKRARQARSRGAQSSVPPGDRMKPKSFIPEEAQAFREPEDPIDFQGTLPTPEGADDRLPYHLLLPMQGRAQAQLDQTAPMLLKHANELIGNDDAEEHVSRGADPQFQGYGSADRDDTAMIKGLAPGFKHPTKYPIENYKRKKATKKEGGGTKLDIGAKGNLKPTDEYIALQEGRIKDTRLGMAGRDIETGTRSRVKLATQKTGKYTRDLGKGVVRDPKTRKIITDKKGNPKMEKKKLVIAPHQKPVEELWGLDRKGMSREEDNPPVRDPFEGRRAIAKEPGKRATKAREADTKHALYVKKAIEADPNYLPTGYNPFQYGAGMSEFDRKPPKGSAVLSTQGARQYIPSQTAYGDLTGVNTTITGADRLRMDDAKAPVRPADPDELVPAFPGAKDIFAKRSTLDYQGISQPPMANLQASNPAPVPSWAPGSRSGRGGGMTATSGSEMALPPGVDVSDAQILRQGFRDMGQEPDEAFISQQIAGLA